MSVTAGFPQQISSCHLEGELTELTGELAKTKLG